jgi:hypothetical protein
MKTALSAMPVELFERTPAVCAAFADFLEAGPRAG